MSVVEMCLACFEILHIEDFGFSSSSLPVTVSLLCTMRKERDNSMGSKDFNYSPHRQDRDLGVLFLLAALKRGRNGADNHKNHKHLLPCYNYNFHQSEIKD